MQRCLMVWWLGIALALGACGTGGAGVGFDAAQLELEDGGFEMTDEAPSFGIEDVVERELPENFFVSEIVEAAESDALESSGKKVYYLHLTWGQLMLASPYFNGGWDTLARSEGVNWSGTLTAATGVTVKVLGVSSPQPQVQITQNGPSVVSFQSLIFGHQDGMLVRVAADATVDPNAPAVSFQTDVISASWRTSDLQALEEVRDGLNSGGDRLAASAMVRPPSNCPTGFMRGRWIRYNERGGRLRGVWFKANGSVAGQFHGIWGRRLNGNRVFYAKVIDASGRALGIIRGTWSDGTFSGTFGPTADMPRGSVQGRFREANGRGFFRGRWTRTDCQP